MPKKSLKVQTFETIREKIVTCAYAPGQMLGEEALQAELGVSRTPIRDALGRLEQMGLVQILPKKGVMVTALTPEDVNMVFEVRMLYEPYALKNYGYTIPANRYLYYCRHLGHLDANHQTAAYFNADDAFHDELMATVPNRYLQASFNTIKDLNLRFRIMSGSTSARRAASNQEHMAILRACLEKDWDAAANAMREHLLQSRNSVFDMILAQQTGES